MSHLLKAIRLQNLSGRPHLVYLRRLNGIGKSDTPLLEIPLSIGCDYRWLAAPGAEIVANKKDDLSFDAPDAEIVRTWYWDNDPIEWLPDNYDIQAALDDQARLRASMIH